MEFDTLASRRIGVQGVWSGWSVV